MSRANLVAVIRNTVLIRRDATYVEYVRAKCENIFDITMEIIEWKEVNIKCRM